MVVRKLDIEVTPGEYAMSSEKRDFDKGAATWDENPTRVKLAEDVAKAILKQDIAKSGMDAMDFGCGTGLLTLRIRPRVRSIVGIDNSHGMLDVLNAKIAKENLKGIETRFIDLDRGDVLEGRFHLIVSSMTLHHIEDIRSLFVRFYDVLAPGGHVCLSDLDSEEGLFHNDSTGVFHFGFDRASLKAHLADAGFEDIEDTTAAEVVKPTADGRTRRFTIFLMTAKKRLEEVAR
jgi:ubiquinone/menaquinone biosynthesis C-methylase UbiE